MGTFFLGRKNTVVGGRPMLRLVSYCGYYISVYSERISVIYIINDFLVHASAS
uniref:Uncharacterized protein n=1 Tax=Arundo donax TaxID=35708 RepID=A0A0A9FAJ4_ARUDO